MNILVPIDFTHISKAGLSSAVNIAKHVNGTIYLFHVIGENSPEAVRPDGDTQAHLEQNEDYNHFMIEMIDKSKHKMAEIIKEHQEENLEIIPIIEIGDFKDKLKDCLDLMPIDIIIMGTSGETSLAEFFSGNHTAQVMRSAGKPVLAVKKEINAHQLNNMLILTDLRGHDPALVSTIRKFARLLGMRVMIGFLKRNKDLIEENLYRRLEKFATKHGFENYSLHVIGNGNKFKNLNAFTVKNEISLVATVTEMEHGFIRLFFGDDTEKMLERLEEPLMALSD